MERIYGDTSATTFLTGSVSDKLKGKKTNRFCEEIFFFQFSYLQIVSVIASHDSTWVSSFNLVRLKIQDSRALSLI